MEGAGHECYVRIILKEGWDRCITRGRLGVELISSEKRPWGKVGAETEGKIKSGVEAGELELPASGCYYTSIMRNGGGGLSLHLGTL